MPAAIKDFVAAMFTSLKLKHVVLWLGLFAGVTAGATACYGLLPAPTESVSQSPSTVPSTTVATTPATPTSSSVSEQVVSQSLSAPNSRSGYRPVELDLAAPSRDRLVGEAPSAVVAQLFGSREALSRSGSEEIQVRYIESRQAVVMLTKVGLADDSVGGMRYRVELEVNATETSPQWQVVWVGQQFKCQPGRGQQAWAGDLCF